MGRRSTIIVLILVMSVLSMSRALTTKAIRENTIRINALEISDPAVVEKLKEEPKEVTIVLDERSLYFDFDKSIVKEQYYGMLKNLVSFILQNNYDITIIGYADSKGTEEYNKKLSLRRAISVKDKLLEFGLTVDRVTGVIGNGESDPVATNNTAEGRALNRRIEFNLVKRN